MPLPVFRIRLVRPLAIAAAAGLALGVPAAATATQQGNSARKDTVEAKQAPDKSPDKSTSAGSTAAAAKPKPPARPKPEWPVKGPDLLPGSILPHKRIVAYYGNPLSKRMGILGELPPDEMLRKLDKEVKMWEKADSTMPVVPALHLITVVAQGSAGKDGMYRARMSDSLIERVHGWAQKHKAIMFLDVQVARSTLQQELPRLTNFLMRPDVHLAIDPEFSMKRGGLPGKRIGTYDAADVNYAIDVLADLVEKYKLPPKVLVVHRFTKPMLTNANRIRLDPRVQVVIHMDGWGPPWMKKDSYDAYVYAEPVQFTGFKLFYKNDTKKGHPLMKPADVLALFPKPIYIQYQ